MDRPEGVNARLRQLPAVERLVAAVLEDGGLARWSALAAAREILEQERARLRDGTCFSTDLDVLRA